ncbi:hypothetical protein AMATHDRAFT_45608 [Amanita thiersii Skay4041]|uniref:Uncharacterized protein n=1 Tax=Amanita thiersii Skay4041 TaxID=703135 RepID=A0A2A9NS33_9AGAR|nr:hypothetical protein AMATHDRAFT_45608 [Amanita thiersii Skay4041]
MITIESWLATLTDAVLIYRCWVVYAQKYAAVIVPSFVWLGGIGCSIASTILLGRESSLLTEATFIKVKNLSGVFYVCTIAVNLYATSAIVLRIWRITSRSGNQKSVNSLHSTIRIIVDSGLLYTLSSVALLIIWFTWDRTPETEAKDLAQVVSSAINSPMPGITFNLILIRVAQQRASRDFAGEGTTNSGLTQEIITSVQIM